MSNIGPTINKDGLEFYFNFESLQCFAERGVPVRNLFTKVSDFTGNGSDFGMKDWGSTTLITSHDPAIITPIGSGATAFVGSETYGVQYIRRFHTPDRNKSSFSFYIYPIANVDYVGVGLANDSQNYQQFRFDDGTIRYGGGNFDKKERLAGFEQVDGYPGWYRCWCRIDDRSGGFIPMMAFNSYGYGIAFASGSIPSGYITGLMQTASPEPNIPYTSGVRDLFEPQIGPTCKLAHIPYTNTSEAPYIRPNSNQGYDGTPETEYVLYCHKKRWIEPQSQPFTPGTGDFTLSYKLGVTSSILNTSVVNNNIFDSDDLFVRLNTRSDGAHQFMITIDGATYYETLNSGLLVSEGVYYIDLVYDRDGDLEIFVNGESGATVDISAKSSSDLTAANMKIFSSASLNAHYFGYYNRKLTNEEITNNYNSLVIQE